jgi:hypothetical protein
MAPEGLSERQGETAMSLAPAPVPRSSPPLQPRRFREAFTYVGRRVYKWGTQTIFTRNSSDYEVTLFTPGLAPNGGDFPPKVSQYIYNSRREKLHLRAVPLESRIARGLLAMARRVWPEDRFTLPRNPLKDLPE